MTDVRPGLFSPLLTDLYQLTMMQAYREQGKADFDACFHMSFRENPFKGGFAVACGLAQVADVIDTFHFVDEDIRYLECLEAPFGGKMFSEDFLAYLSELSLEVDVDAVPEGTVVFPYEPLMRVTGSLMQCQLLETLLLNIVNFQTLVATKAMRVCLAAQVPVAEFGLRRAQGPAGGLWASRAAVVGGCASTSNVLAGKMFSLPVSGTHAHSWVMAFDSELEAFRAYAASMPRNCTLLVDTYDVRQGIENAVTVGLEMKERGEKLAAIRIDSGDLAWFSKRARRRLDEAGLADCGIVLSNDLDEYTIQSLRDQGACATAYGVGTKLATAYDQPSLGGVYKLSALRSQDGDVWEDRLKLSEQSVKLSVPGVLDVRRYQYDDGTFAGDMIFDVNKEIGIEEIIIDPRDSLRRKSMAGMDFHTQLQPLVRKGCNILSEDGFDALVAQRRARTQIVLLDETHKRMLNPHSYAVGLERNVSERREKLVLEHRGLEKPCRSETIDEGDR